MSSKTYWEDRERAKQKRVDEVTDVEVKKVRKAINDAIRSLDDEIHRIYIKYSIDNKMTYADALKYLTNDEREEFQKDLQYYIEKNKDSEYVKKHAKELHSLSVRARVQRIEAFIAEIKQHSGDLEEMLNNGTREQISALYTEGYLRQIYELFEGNAPESAGAIAPAFNARAVRQILDTPWSGSNYSDKVWNLSDSFTNKLQQVLTQGLIQGQHPDVIARNFRIYGFGKSGAGGLVYRAESLIRTEAANIIEQAQKEAYRDHKIKTYYFMTATDHRVCDKCAPLNGKEFPLDEAAQGKNYPPMHPCCRCTTKAKTKFDENDDDYYRLYEDDYDAWYKKYVEPEANKIDIQQTKQEMQEITDSLSKEQKDMCTKYTGNWATQVNTAIGLGVSLDKYKEDMKTLDSAFSKGTIPRDLTLYRCTDVRFLSGYTGKGKITQEAVEALVGSTITNDIYTSTSFVPLDLGIRNTFITLHVPAGAKGALYIKSVAHDRYKYQDEVLFGRGLRYEIKSARMEKGKVYLEAEVLTDD